MKTSSRVGRLAIAAALAVMLSTAVSGCSACTPRGAVKIVSADTAAFSIDCLEGCGADASITRLGNETDRTWRLELSNLDSPVTVAVLDRDGEELSRGSVAPDWDDTADCSTTAFAPDIRIG